MAAHMLAAASAPANPLDAIRAGCAARLHLAASDPAVRQIVLTDAPAVVGWRTWREIDAAHGLGLLRRALCAAAGHGLVPADQVELYAQGLLAVLIEMALVIASAPADEHVLRSGLQGSRARHGRFGMSGRQQGRTAFFYSWLVASLRRHRVGGEKRRP